jgi:hypothetical protein
MIIALVPKNGALAVVRIEFFHDRNECPLQRRGTLS